VNGVLMLRTRAAWRRKWPSLIGVALLIAITLAVTLTAVSGARRTRSAPARFLREDVTPDVLVVLPPGSTLQQIDAISKLPQVKSASINAAVAAYPYSKAGVYMPVFAPVDGTGGVTAARGLLLKGRRPDPRAADEIMLSESHARTLGAHVGDDIPMVAFTPAQSSRCLYADGRTPACRKIFRTPRFSVRVVGITRTANDVNSRASDIGISTVSGGFFARHRADVGWNPLAAVRLRPGASSESFVTAARHQLPAGVDAEFDLVNANASFDAVDVLSTGLALFALVAGLAGAFAVGQAVARQVRADDDERTVLATLGATREGLYSDALAPVLLATALGIVLALVLTFFASAWMPIGFARRIDPKRGRELDGLMVVIGIAITFLLAAVVSVGAVRSSRRLVPNPRTSRLSGFLTGIAASPAALVGLRNASSPGRGRQAVPVRSAFVGVAAATAGIVGVLGFSAGLAHLVHEPSLYGWTFDLVGVNPKYEKRVIADRAVAAVADVHAGVHMRVNDRPTFGQVFAPIVGDAGPAIVTGRAPATRDEIALGADTMSAAHVHVGDTVVGAGADGKLAMRVVGQAVFPTGADAYPLADGAIITPAGMAVLGEGDSADMLAVRFRPGVDKAAAFARLDALDAKSDPNADPPERPAPPAEVEKLRQVESLPKILAMFLALLGVIALAHALVVGARRRARDFAVLRALGFRRRNVRSAVSWEAGALAFAGAAIGIPLGIILARLAWARTARGIGVMVVQRTALPVVLVIVPVAVILAIAIALIPARRAAKMRPAEILRSE
jgi:hypothetical protein